MEKLTISVDEMAQQLGINRNSAYQLAHSEGFPAIRVTSRRILIPVDGLKNWLAAQANA